MRKLTCLRPSRIREEWGLWQECTFSSNSCVCQGTTIPSDLLLCSITSDNM